MIAKLTPEKRLKLSKIVGSTQLIIVVSVLVAALIVNRVLLATGGGNGAVADDAGAPLVEVVSPGIETAQIVLQETGVIDARARIDVTPQVGGRVIRVADGFAAGGVFEAGDTLFEIDPADADLRVQQAQADLRAARSALELEKAEADVAVREWRIVNGDEAIPPLVARKPQLAQARASVATAEARLADAKLALSRTTFSMPFEGRVVSTTIEPGVTVNSNQSYGSVYAVDAVEAIVSLTQQDLSKLEPAIGRDAVISLRESADDLSTRAKIIRVESALDPRSRLASVYLDLDDQTDFLPGAFIDATIYGPTLNNVVALPIEAVSPAGQVWVVANGALQRRSVEIAQRTASEALVRNFDMADGVVVVAPARAREGLAVDVADDGGEQTIAAAGPGE
ncbi:MAG: efflux RND transporter periplasmic adaptor subunit [Pseudomonadota bacterium]